jgi:hypothetical protein
LVALPFLESLPHRSAWASDAPPVFSLYICAVLGVVPAEFFPSATGALTREGLASAGKATSHLAAHAEHLLFVSGVNWPRNILSDAHAEGFCQVLTATAPVGSGTNAMGGGPSADVVVASHLHPDRDPLTLYAGNRKNGFMAERLSFAGPGKVRAATDNPYTLYLELMGLAAPGGAMTPEGERAAGLLARSRKSIHDLVRDDLTGLMRHPRLSSADRQRLQLHFDSIRDLEVAMGGMGNIPAQGCSLGGLDVEALESCKDYVYDPITATEKTLRLHMSLVALAFACDYRRTATIQWGDGYDHTRYQVPSNASQFPFSFIAHRNQSDGFSGATIPNAEQAHAEIDVVRMQSLAAGLDHFKARGLQDQCFVMWTNHFRDSPAHSFRNVPHIIWGSGGGYLKQGQYIDVGGVNNNRLHNTLITAAIRDTGKTVEDFGGGTGGLLTEIMA